MNCLVFADHTTHTGEHWLSLPHDAAIRRDGFLPPGHRQELLFQEELAAYANPTLRDRVANEKMKDLPLLESLSLSLAIFKGGGAPSADCGAAEEISGESQSDSRWGLS